VVVAQPPNASLAVFLACTVALWLVDPAGDVRAALVVVRTLALGVWAVDELLRGVNPFRRILGATVLTATLIGLLTG
jgi:uncharacterized membrane protein YpjA